MNKASEQARIIAKELVSKMELDQNCTYLIQNFYPQENKEIKKRLNALNTNKYYNVITVDKSEDYIEAVKQRNICEKGLIIIVNPYSKTNREQSLKTFNVIDERFLIKISKKKEKEIQNIAQFPIQRVSEFLRKNGLFKIRSYLFYLNDILDAASPDEIIGSGLKYFSLFPDTMLYGITQDQVYRRIRNNYDTVQRLLTNIKNISKLKIREEIKKQLIGDLKNTPFIANIDFSNIIDSRRVRKEKKIDEKPIYCSNFSIGILQVLLKSIRNIGKTGTLILKSYHIIDSNGNAIVKSDNNRNIVIIRKDSENPVLEWSRDLIQEISKSLSLAFQFEDTDNESDQTGNIDHIKFIIETNEWNNPSNVFETLLILKVSPYLFEQELFFNEDKDLYFDFNPNKLYTIIDENGDIKDVLFDSLLQKLNNTRPLISNLEEINTVLNNFIEKRKYLASLLTNQPHFLSSLSVFPWKKEIEEYIVDHQAFLSIIFDNIKDENQIEQILESVFLLDTFVYQNQNRIDYLITSSYHPHKIEWLLVLEELVLDTIEKILTLVNIKGIQKIPNVIEIKKILELSNKNYPLIFAIKNQYLFPLANFDFHWTVFTKDDISLEKEQTKSRVKYLKEKDVTQPFDTNVFNNIIRRYVASHPYSEKTLKLLIVNIEEPSMIESICKHVLDKNENLNLDVRIVVFSNWFYNIADEFQDKYFETSDFSSIPRLSITTYTLRQSQALSDEIDLSANIGIIGNITTQKIRGKSGILKHVKDNSLNGDIILGVFDKEYIDDPENPEWRKQITYNTETDRIFQLLGYQLYTSEQLSKYPYLNNRIENRELHDKFAQHCDWLVHIDKNFGAEYYDQPNKEDYIIHSEDMPSRSGIYSIITTTKRKLDIISMIQRTLKEMGIDIVEDLEKAANLLLNRMKSISGILPLRSLESTNKTKESISQVFAQELLKDKFSGTELCILIPLDDFHLIKENSDSKRADLLLVSINEESDIKIGIKFNIIELKYRKKLSNLLEERNHIIAQLNDTRKILVEKLNEERPDRIFHLSDLVEKLEFYIKKMFRYSLVDEEKTKRFKKLFATLHDKKISYDYCFTSYCFIKELVSHKEKQIFVKDFKELAKEKLLSENSIDISLFDLEDLRKIFETNFDLQIDPIAQEIQKSELIQTIKTDTDTNDVKIQRQLEKKVKISSKKKIKDHMKPVKDSTNFRIHIGTDKIEQKILLEPEKEANPHIMIVGSSGNGKTQFMKYMLYMFSKHQRNSLILDYNDDYASDLKFTEATNAAVLDVWSQGIDINPLEFNPSIKESPKSKVFAISSIMDRVFNLGIQQKDLLMKVIENTYLSSGISSDDPSTWNNSIPSFYTIFYELKKLKDSGSEDNRVLGKLMARIRPLFMLDIFSRKEKQFPFEELLNKTFIINLSQLPNDELKNLVAEFMLKATQNYMMVKGHQKLSFFIAIDEAHRITKKAESISELAREARKYGIGLILSSQQPSDFKEEIFGNTATKICFNLSSNKDARVIDKQVPTRNVSAEIMSLEKFNVLYIVRNKVKRMEIIPFFKYKL